MKGFKSSVASSILIFIILLSSASVFAQKEGKIQKFLNNLKPGEWAEVEGTFQRDFTILLKEVEVIYGEVEEDDWEITGPISNVLPEEKKISMLFLPIKFNKDTEYGDDSHKIKSFSDLRPGMYVEIEGSYYKDSTFVASEIAVEKVKEEDLKVVEWKGKVESVNPKNNSFTILGHTVVLAEATKIKSFVNNQ